jgi:hypothetical protein
MSIVFAPPGSGKTSWLRSPQNVKRKWLDADDLCFKYALHDRTFHQCTDHTFEDIIAHYKKIDGALSDWKQRGWCVLGSLFWEYRPDRIILINEQEHRRRVHMRQDLDWERVASIRDMLRQRALKENIPVYDSFETGLHLY